MRRKRKGVFRLLIRNNIIYLFLFLASVIVGLIAAGVSLGDTFTSNKAPEIFADMIEVKDYRKINTEDIIEIGGWIEVLDKDLNVIFTKGNKKDPEKISYSQKELFEMLGQKISHKLICSIKGFKGKNGENLYLLVKYPEESMKITVNLQKYGEQVSKPFLRAILYGLIVFLILIVSSTIFSVFRTRKKIVTPLEHILFGIKRMKNGEYVEDMDFKGEREFQEIKDAFNDMNRKLRESNQEKQLIERNRNRMFRDLSHDIKTPITSIQGFSRILMEDRIDDLKKDRYYETIYNKACRVGILVDNLFQYVKLESPEMKIQTQQGDMCEFLRLIISEYYEEIEEKGMHLKVEIPEKEIRVEFDPVLLQRAILNVIENAIKYNPQGTTIRVSLKEGEGLILEIGDNGLGIPEKLRENIFEAFTRGDQARSTDGGTGLGLSITRKIIELHGWIISLKDESNQEKTTFLIKIKASKVQ